MSHDHRDLEPGQLAAYLDRIGAEGPSVPDLNTLQRLHTLHERWVPFENLSVHAGEELSLTAQALIDKIVGRRRGGICYELNGAFGLLLAALGFPVTLLPARVFADGDWGPPYGHLVLQVTVDGRTLLADVGFASRHIPLVPLDDSHDLGCDAVQVQKLARGFLMTTHQQRLYLIETPCVPLALTDFEPMLHWQRTSANSRFTKSLICSASTPQGRLTLAADRLIVTSEHGRRETQLRGPAQVLAAYRDNFGITLDRCPTLLDQQ